jgi:spore coat protein A
MPHTRRRFLHLLAATAATARAQRTMPMPAAPKAPMLHAMELTPFADALPLPVRVPAHNAHIAMREIHAKLHRDVPPTRLWSYGATPLAPLLEARSGSPARVTWMNNLPRRHFLPIDHTLHGCGKDVPEVRACVHLHGGRVPWHDDGHPDDWYLPGHSRICNYPMQQDAATLWYHDHAMGINRLNIYAGLAGMCLIRDAAEDALNLPQGAYELPLTLYDRNLTEDGQLFYPVSDDPARPWVPEFDGEALLLNGKIRPFAEVEPRLYRLRILNASNSRFFALSFSGGVMTQIGSDQGLLAEPVSLDRLILAPAERADVLIDLSMYAGQRVHLRHNAIDILELRVGPRTAASLAAPALIPPKLRTIERTPESSAILTRRITLNEYQDEHGRSMVMLLNRKAWHEPVTERPKLNTTEIWEFVNQTGDTHPMHLHLVRFQILDRRTFDQFAFMMHREMRYTSPSEMPRPNEMGWKDVVQCDHGMVTRVIVRFEGYTGNYLYHCHILEHEANDMMRPFEVIA